MQHTYLLLLALLTMAFALTGCDGSKVDEEEREKLVRYNVERYYQEHAPPDNGYEFMSLELVNTIYYKDNIAYRRKFIQEKIDYNRSMLSIAESKQDSFPLVNFNDKIIEYRDKAERYEQVMAGIDSLEKALGDKVNEVASYTYLFKCKENAQSQQVEKEYYVQTDLGYGVLRFTDNREDLYPNPNDFPGYREMARKILVEAY